MWGIVPMTGLSKSHVALSVAKELEAARSRASLASERTRAVGECVLARMLRAGAQRICLVVPERRSEILQYFGGTYDRAHLCYVVQDRPLGVCDALFRALPLVTPWDQVLVGYPDTVWFPEDGFCELADDELSLLLFRVAQPQRGEAVLTDQEGRVRAIEVKHPQPSTQWILGAFKLTGLILQELYALWMMRDQADRSMGTLLNAYLAHGGEARAVHARGSYVDVNCAQAYGEALTLVSAAAAARVDDEEPDSDGGSDSL